MNSILIALHVVSVAGLAIYGVLGYVTLWLYFRYRHAEVQADNVSPAELPFVTVQLPVFNESEVVERLIRAAGSLEYPRDRLEIQVLDDSTDLTTEIASRVALDLQNRGIDVRLIHRPNRQGFKAGALAAGLESARGEFIAIFDADFMPYPDFLRRTIPFFLDNADLGVVQTRWDHLNEHESGLTKAQAIAMDKHFAIDQFVRHRAGLFPKFNGSAGVWRRSCIQTAGGWHGDTACEDLCLSTRAVLAGWKFHYTNDIIAPAELPSTVLAYKTQQSRWALGATQCLRKYAWAIWREPRYSLPERLYAVLSMGAYTTYLFALLLLIVQLPLTVAGLQLPRWMWIFSLIGLGQPILMLFAQSLLHDDWPRRLWYLPSLLVVAIGLTPSTSWAVLRGLFGRDFTFTRTPKGNRRAYRQSPGRMLGVELLLMIYSAVTLAWALATHNTGPVLLMGTSVVGLGYMVITGIVEARQSAGARTPAITSEKSMSI